VMGTQTPAEIDDDGCEDCGGRFVFGTHYCFGLPVSLPIETPTEEKG
jgi:hypothetical protein